MFGGVMTTISKNNYKEILSKRPFENDTKITNTKFIKGSLFLLVERWNWDGICGTSAIAYTSQLRSKDKSRVVEEICQILKMKVPEEREFSLKINEDFTFISYDFES
jgi:hypothetical protein